MACVGIEKVAGLNLVEQSIIFLRNMNLLTPGSGFFVLGQMSLTKFCGVGLIFPLGFSEKPLQRFVTCGANT